jgi:hypothetical protein
VDDGDLRVAIARFARGLDLARLFPHTSGSQSGGCAAEPSHVDASRAFPGKGFGLVIVGAHNGRADGQTRKENCDRDRDGNLLRHTVFATEVPRGRQHE